MTPAFLALTLAITAPVTQDKEPPKKEAALVGKWVGERIKVGGKLLPLPVGGVSKELKSDGTVLL
jgi:hypothetical protein